MPQIAELKEIDGEIWCRVGKPPGFPNGIALWTPDEQKAMDAKARAEEREACAKIAENTADKDGHYAWDSACNLIANAIRQRSE